MTSISSSIVPVTASYRDKVIAFSPNRVWRSYQGGSVLDKMSGITRNADGHFPEDWIGSVTSANNNSTSTPLEGLSTIDLDGDTCRLRDLVEGDPVYFLGAEHAARFGPDPRLLVKFLDSAIRLHFQVHPTTPFAQSALGARCGKTEAYYVLGVRPGHDGLLYLGFQRPPSRNDLRRLIEEQDIGALERCFDPVRAKAGDTFIVPAGTPHAVGAGLLVVELQEPSDLVVRFEFSRGGITIPESARFLNRGLNFCLDIFDLTPRPSDTIGSYFRCRPRRLRTLGDHSWADELIGPKQTDCFRLTKLHLSETSEIAPNGFTIGIVVVGRCSIESPNGVFQSFSLYTKFLLPASLGPVRISPSPYAEILLCQPPRAGS